MKKCEYCGKELESYHLQYCKDSDCEERALSFYDSRRKNEKVFGIINIITIIAIMAGLFLAVFVPIIGNIIVAAALVVMGIGVLAMPYAPENFYQKYRIKKTTKMVRIFGVMLFVAAGIFSALAVYYSLK
ncbi:MAG: hypothetical protein II685_00430 [Clostridia bacterium]|nr:hypothetical protein [Clostridia bacterium]